MMEEEINGPIPENNVEYTEDNIRHLDDMEHIRVRSGMYIGRLGDGSQNDDGIYVLLKEVRITASMNSKWVPVNVSKSA